MILIVAKNPIRPEYADDFAALIGEFTEATRAEPGNICFDWYRSVEDPNVYVLVEAFADGAAGEVHVTPRTSRPRCRRCRIISPVYRRS
jgi:quinol monooxygenase YgiN